MDDVVHIGIRQRGVQRNTENSLEVVMRCRKVLRTIAILVPEEGMQVNGDEVNRRADILRVQLLNELVPRD